MMEARGHIDVLIPRGGAGLIQAVVRNSKVPVIETGAGNVHIYVDRTGNPDKAIPILINAKTQRVAYATPPKTPRPQRHRRKLLPKAAAALAAAGVEMHADERAYDIIEHAGIANAQLVHATDEDWDTEYLHSKSASRWPTRLTRPSRISTATPPGTPNPSSPKTIRPSRNSPPASTRRW